MISAMGGAIITAFIRALGGGGFFVGMADMTANVGAICQLATNRLLQAVGSRRIFCMLCLGGVRVVRIGLVLLPVIAATGAQSMALWCLVLILALGHTGGNIGHVSRLSWIADITPLSIRGRFLAKRDLVMGVVGLSVAILASRFLDLWGRYHPQNVLTGYQVLCVFSVVCGFGSIVCFYLGREPLMRGPTKPQTFLGNFALPFHDREYRRFMWFNIHWSFGVGFAGGFFDFYMLTHLKLSITTVVLINAVGMLASLYCLPLWGRLIDRFGNRPLLTMCVLVKGAFPVMWIAAGPDTWFLALLVVLARSFNSAQRVATVNLALKLAPEDNRAMFLSMQRSTTGIARAISPVITGCVLKSFGDLTLDLGFMAFIALHAMFLTSATLRLTSLVWLLRIREPNVKAARRMIRVLSRTSGFRPQRGLGRFLGFWLGPVLDAWRRGTDVLRHLRRRTRRSDPQDGEEAGD